MSYNFLNNLVKTQFPDLWSQACPRVIKHADSFGDFQVAATAIAVNLLVNGQPDFVDDSTRRCAEVAVKLLDKKIPTFYIAHNLAQAVSASNPPPELRWSEVNLPFEAAVLIPPKNFLNHVKFGAVDFIAYGRFADGEIVKTPERTVKFATDHFTVFTALRDEPNFPQQHRTLNDAAPTIGDAVFSSERIFLDGEVYDSPFAKYMTLDDANFMNELMIFTFGVLLVISSRPALIARGRRAGRHKKSGLSIWTPNIVGGEYSLRRDRTDGQGAAKRAHWRRGHFRNQPHGKNRAESRIIWIEPVLIGVPENGGDK